MRLLVHENQPNTLSRQHPQKSHGAKTGTQEANSATAQVFLQDWQFLRSNEGTDS